MCVPGLFGGGRSAPPAPPVQAPPTAPPAPMPIQSAPTPLPASPTPTPVSEDETKRKAKVTAKKVAKKSSKGTSQLATKKPETGGLQGISTPQGTNTGSGSSAGGSY